MTLLILGMAIFIGIHMVPTFPNIRETLVRKWGENPYKGGFSLVSFVGLILISLCRVNSGL